MSHHHRLPIVVASAALLVLGVPGLATAGGGSGTAPPPSNYSSTPNGPSSASLSSSQTSTTTHGGGQGSAGSSGSSSSSGSTGSSSGSTPLTFQQILGGGGSGPGTGACDPAAYGPGGYSPTFQVPSPCIQPGPATPPKPGQPAPAPVITTQMVTQAAVVTAPATPPHVEPGTLSFVNIPNNYWTEGDVVRTSVTLLGQTIPLVWTPTATTWSFGDGSSATGEGVRGATVGAAGAVEHSYARQGTYAITTSTTYDLSFVLPGQGAQTISLVSPPSPAVNLPVREVQTLVDWAR